MAFGAKKQSKNDKAPAKEAAAPKRKKSARDSQPKTAGRTKSSGKRFVIIVGDEGAILVFMQGAKVVRRLFAPSAQPSHTEAMRELMQANADVPVYLLADVMDQQYVPHTFPPVSAMSVGGLVKRRLDRDFQPEDLKGALRLGRDKAGRKEWRYLLVSLAKTSVVGEWIDLLVELPNEMKGVYLVPVEAVNYLAMLSKAQRQEKPLAWQLLISHNKVSGFRQVVINNGKLVFTRVSQAIDDALPAVVAGNIEQEIINTIEYLKRLEFRDSADLEAFVITSSDIGESIDLKRFGFGRGQVLSPLDISDALGLDQAALSADRFGDVVMAAAFGIAKRRGLRFATVYMDRLAKLYGAGKALRLASRGIAALLLLLAGVGAVGIVTDYQAIGAESEKTRLLQADLAKYKKSVDSLNKDVAFKTALVATFDAYIKNVPTPDAFAKDIGPFITREHRITEFSWKYAVSDDKPAAAAGALPLEVKTQMDFSGSGTTVEALSKSANTLMEDVKVKLPQYEVVAEPFPWLKEEPKQEDLTLDISNVPAVSAQNMVVKVDFKGLKPVTGGAAPATGSQGHP